jgi:hypothetical protein
MTVFCGRNLSVSWLSVPPTFAFATICSGFLLAGCSSRGPEVHLVEGVVTLDGVALAGADVGFSPVVRGGGLSAVGGTRDDGSFTLNAMGARPGRGTAVGDYVVTVRKFESSSSPKFISYEDRGRDSPPPILSQPNKADPPAQSLIPTVYGDQQTSPLKASVSPGKNSFQFDLKSDAKGVK